MRSALAWKVGGIVVVLAAAGILIGFYIANWLLSGPPTYRPSASANAVDIKIQTVAAVGPTLAPNPD